MNCDWCHGKNAREDLSSARCEDCGGAHWKCPTAACGRSNAECRAFCSGCGAARSYPALDGNRKPSVIVCRTSGFKLGSETRQERGLYARTAEAFSYEGRLVIAAPRQIFAAPNPALKKNPTMQALGLVCEANADDGVFSTPALLSKGAMLITSAKRTLCASLHTGELKTVANTGSVIAPLARLSATAAEAWTATADALRRFSYGLVECLELGALTQVSQQAAPGLYAGALQTNPAEDSVLFLAATKTGEPAKFYQLDPPDGTLKDMAAFESCVLPRTERTRARLWSTAAGEWFWFSRGALWEEDGALPVQKTGDSAARQAKEIEYAAFMDAVSGRFNGVSISEVRQTVVSPKPFDGIWVRSAAGRRWGWCGDETVRLESELHAGGWNGEELLAAAGVKPDKESFGPLVPTRWGFATFITERASQSRGDAIAVLYFDFPKV